MLTAVDHWLRDKFLLQTHIYTMRLPKKVVRGLKVRELPESASNRYRYRLISNSGSATDKMVKKLDEEGLMYVTQVIERKTALTPIISPKGGSVLLLVFWLFSFFGLCFGGFKLYQNLSSNEVFIQNLSESFDIFTESGRN